MTKQHLFQDQDTQKLEQPRGEVRIAIPKTTSKQGSQSKSESQTISHLKKLSRCEGCWRSTPWTAHNRISWTDLESVKSPHSVRPRKEESKIKVQTRCKVLLPAGQAAGYEG